MEIQRRMPEAGEFFAAVGATYRARTDPFHVRGIGLVVEASRVAHLEEGEGTLCVPEWVRAGLILGTLDEGQAMAAHLRQFARASAA
jgi:hypothetical protein